MLGLHRRAVDFDWVADPDGFTLAQPHRRSWDTRQVLSIPCTSSSSPAELFYGHVGLVGTKSRLSFERIERYVGRRWQQRCFVGLIPNEVYIWRIHEGRSGGGRVEATSHSLGACLEALVDQIAGACAASWLSDDCVVCCRGERLDGAPKPGVLGFEPLVFSFEGLELCFDQFAA